jgi:hypothetical protein
VKFLNTGTATWVRGAAGQHANLGSNNPQDNTRDYDRGILVAPLPGDPNRYSAMDESVVAPGSIGTFTFTVRAPGIAGSYDIFVRPVIEGVTWMEDEGVFLRIVVP